MKKFIINDLDDEDKIDGDIYSKETREELVDGGELSPEEEAFMKGYEDAG